MSDQVLNILKYFLLALVWLFFLRILRVVWVEIRSADGAGGPGAPGDMAAREGVIPAVRRRAGRRAAPPTPAPAPGAAPPPSRAPTAVTAPAAGTTRRPARLRVVEPAEIAGHSYPLDGDGELVVGRTTGSGVALPGDSFVSSRHARVFPRGDEVWVEDLGSTNGTFVNSARISSPTVLRPGDRLQIGRTVLEVDG
ncbi:MAG TPA: FHA domain-containing protein [Acidimicrobiales bacterium]|nr:FHA domain-containing protein [Acidimicrobiales bacterium]